MRKVIILLALMFIVGCDDNRSDSEKLKSAGLVDCSMHHVNYVTVIRCPNSTVTTKYSEAFGKGMVSRQSIVIDGQRFIIDNEKGE